MSLLPSRTGHGSWCIALVLAGLLAGCGGGGGGASTREPLPPLSQDVLPAGARIDRIALDHFADQPGNTWTYDSTDTFNPGTSVVTRTASAGVGGDVVITETGGADAFSEIWRRTAEGLLQIQPLADLGIGGGADVPSSLLLYPEPFYPVGAQRQMIRQGSLGADLDGDGQADSFRIDIRQVLVGFESVTLPSGTLADVAHFRNVTRITVQPSDPEVDTVTLEGTEDSWWAPGIGLVRAVRAVSDGAGTPIGGVQTLVLTGGTVRGRTLFLPEPDGTLTVVALALVYDSGRNHYYPSVRGSVPLHGNSIASIDPATGAVSYSGPVGSEPAALAISADGSVLYAGLDGSGDVLRLRLPDMVELGRTRLPAPDFYGQLLAESIAVSPADPGVVAVSTRRVGISPRHGGVVLIRDDVLQPTMTQDHTGSNLLTFGSDGNSVYGYNNESTEFGLRRLAVLADGLQEVQVVDAGSSSGFSQTTLSYSPRGLLLGRALWQTPDLALLGTHAAEGGLCRWHEGSARVVCLGTASSGEDRFLTVADPLSFVVQATPVFRTGYGQEPIAQIVPGPRGQVALRIGLVYVGTAAEAIWLFTTPALE